MRLDEEEVLIRDDSGLLHGGETAYTDRQHGWCKKLTRTLSLSLGFFVLGLCFAIPGPTLLDLGDRVQATVAEMMMLFVARSAGYLLGAVVGGVLFDCFDKQLLLFCTLLISSVATVTIPWSLTLVVMATMFGLQGITMGVLDTGGNVFCIRLWGKKSGPYIQTLHFAFGIGAFIAPLLATPFLSTEMVTYNSSLLEGNIPVSPYILDKIRHNRTLRSDMIFGGEDSLHFDLHNIDDIIDTKDGSFRIKRDDSSATTSTTVLPSTQQTSSVGVDSSDPKSTNNSSVDVSSSEPGVIVKVIPPKSDVTDKSVSQTDPLNSDMSTPALVKSTHSVNISSNVSTNTSVTHVSTNVSTVTASTTVKPDTGVKKPSAATDEKLNPKFSDGGSISKHLDKHKDDSVVPTQPVSDHLNTTVSPVNTASTPAGTANTASGSGDASLTGAVNNGNNTNNVNVTHNMSKPVNDSDAQTNKSTAATISQAGTTLSVTGGAVTETITNKTLTDAAITTSSSTSLAPTITKQTTTKQTTTEQTTAKQTTTKQTTTEQTTTEQTTAKQTTTTRTTTTSTTTEATTTPTTTTTTVQTTTSTTRQPDVTTTQKVVTTSTQKQTQPPTHRTTTTSIQDHSATVQLNMTGVPVSGNISTGSPGPSQVTQVSTKPSVTKDSFINNAIQVIRNISKIQFAYLIIGLALFVNAVIFLVLYCRDKGRLSAPDDLDEYLSARKVRGCYRTTVTVLMGVFLLCYMGLEVTYGALVTSFVVDFLHWPKSQGATVAAIFWGSLATGRGVSIFIARCCGPVVMLSIDLVLMVLGGLVLSIGLYFYAPLIWLGTLVLGLGMSSVFPASLSWAENYIHLTGKTTAIFTLGSGLGQIIFPTATGYFFEIFEKMVLMQITAGTSVFLLILFIMIQCFASSTSQNVYIQERNGFLPLQDEEEENMELDLIHFDKSETRRRRDRRAKGETEYKTLISDLEDD